MNYIDIKTRDFDLNICHAIATMVGIDGSRNSLVFTSGLYQYLQQ